MVKHFHHARYFFFLFSAMGIVSPYVGWWLQQVLDPLSASTVLACLYATIIVVPSLWGHAAFTSNRPGSWLSRGTLFACIFALGLTQIHSGQVEDTHTYSRIRLYGSLGFMIFSSIIGGVLVLSHPSLFPYLVSAVMLVAYVVSLPYQQAPHIDYQLSGNMREAFPRLLWQLKGLWVVVVLSKVSFVIY